jgi:tetratricopeptide (TPR) repeat protein
MMDPTTATFVLTMVLPGVIAKCIDVSTNLGMDKWKNATAIGNAVNTFTATLPSHRSEMAKALRTWLQSDAFATKAKEEGRAWPIDQAIQLFREVTGIESSPVAEMSLDEVIGEFLIELAVQFEVVDPRARIRSERARFIQIMDRLSVIDSRVDNVQESIRETSRQILARLDENKSPTIFSYEVQDAEDRLPAEAELHSRIDVAVEHLEHGKVTKARDLLLTIRLEIGSSSDKTAYLRSRIACNLGVCYMRLELVAEARDEYQQALNLRATRLNYSNLAAAALNLNEQSVSLMLSRQAMGFPKTNGRTVAIHLQVLYRNGLTDELAELLATHEDLCKADPDCLLALGQLKYDQTDFIGARGYFEKARVKAPYDSQLYLLCANCILKNIETPFQTNTPLDGKLAPETSNLLKEANKLIEEALALTNENDFALTHNRALEFRASAAFLEMNYEAAEADCQKILKTDPDNQIALMKLGYLALLLRNDSAESIRHFELVTANNLAPMAVLAAGAYINLGDIAKANAALAVFKEEAEKRRLWYVYAYETIRIAIIENREDEALSGLLAEYPTNGDVLYAVAEAYKRRKETKKTLELLEQASLAEECTLKSYIPRIKAQTYFDAGLWTAASETYEGMPNLRKFKQDWYEYIAALANIEDKSMLGTAGTEAKNARMENDGEVIPVISEIEAAADILKFNDPRKALTLLIPLWQNHPHTPMTEQFLRLANMRIGRKPLDLSDPY